MLALQTQTSQISQLSPGHAGYTSQASRALGMNGRLTLTMAVADSSAPTCGNSSPQISASTWCWRSEHPLPPEGGYLLLSQLGCTLLSSS